MSLKIKSITTLLFIFLITSFCTFAQEPETRIKTQHLYTISKVTSIDQVTSIKSEIETLQFVEKVKLNMKDEASGKAQLIIYVNEPKKTSESQIMFQSTSLKKLILKDGIDLLEYKTNNY